MEETEFEAAQRHVNQSRRIVAAQKDKIARLKVSGYDARSAENELELLENALAICEQHLRSLQP